MSMVEAQGSSDKGFKILSFGGEDTEYYASLVEQSLNESDTPLAKMKNLYLGILIAEDQSLLARYAGDYRSIFDSVIRVWVCSKNEVKVRCDRTVYETFASGSYFATQFMDYIEFVCDAYHRARPHGEIR